MKVLTRVGITAKSKELLTVEQKKELLGKLNKILDGYVSKLGKGLEHSKITEKDIHFDYADDWGMDSKQKETVDEMFGGLTLSFSVGYTKMEVYVEDGAIALKGSFDYKMLKEWKEILPILDALTNLVKTNLKDGKSLLEDLKKETLDFYKKVLSEK